MYIIIFNHLTHAHFPLNISSVLFILQLFMKVNIKHICKIVL